MGRGTSGDFCHIIPHCSGVVHRSIRLSRSPLKTYSTWDLWCLEDLAYHGPKGSMEKLQPLLSDVNCMMHGE